MKTNAFACNENLFIDKHVVLNVIIRISVLYYTHVCVCVKKSLNNCYYIIF